MCPKTDPVEFPVDEFRRPFVLLHGGRHGAWCWRKVTPLLSAAGHRVYTPTLTGLGERSHLARPDVGLDVHSRDLVNVFEFEDISEAILVAHSYGGIVATIAMNEIADRVHRLIFLDALVPGEGESVFDLMGPAGQEVTRARVNEFGEGWYLPVSDASYWGLTDPADIAWANPRITAQPIKTFSDKAHDVEKGWSHPGAYIECTGRLPFPVPLELPRRRHETDPDFEYRLLDTCHDAMVSAPGALVDMLLELIDDDGRVRG